MSTNILKLVSITPQYTPSAIQQQEAKEFIASRFPQAEVEVTVTETVQFIDSGTNFTKVACPVCKNEIDLNRWQELMDKAYQTQFADLLISCPHCAATTTLDDLEYEWPVGFARFIIEVRNLDNDTDSNALSFLEQVLRTKLRKIWAHY